MNIAAQVISAISFYLAPIIIGSAIFTFVKLPNLVSKNKKSSKNPSKLKVTKLKFIDIADAFVDQSVYLFSSFVVGALAVFSIAINANTISRNSGFLSNGNFYETYKYHLEIALFFSVIVLLLKFALNITQTPVNFKKKTLLFWGLFLGLALMSYGIWRWDSPLNTTLDWDLYEHQTVVNIMKEGKFSTSPLKLTDTFQFNSYSTLFHVLLLTPQTLFENVDILGFWWFVEFFHLYSTIIASFLIAYVVTRNTWISSISALIGGLTFESFVAYTTFFLMPQNLAATIAVVGISRTLFKYKQNERIMDVTVGAYVAYLILNHMIIGFAGVVMIVCTSLYLWLFKKIKDVEIEHMLLLVALTLLVGVPTLTSGFDLSGLNNGEAEFFTFSVLEKIRQIQNFYGYSIFVLFTLGMITILNKRRTPYTLIALLCIGSFAAIFASIPYTLKFYTLGRFVVHVVMALGFWDLIKDSSNKIRFGAMLLYSVSMVVILGINSAEFKQTPSHREIATHISTGELEAANYIRENYFGENAMIVGEPSTMYILEGISGVNSPGGTFTNVENRRILSELYLSRDSSRIKAQLFEIKDGLTPPPDKILFAVSGRYSRWQEARQDKRFGIFWNVWTPRDLTLEDYTYIEFLEDKAKLDLVFKNQSIIIYEVSKQDIAVN